MRRRTCFVTSTSTRQNRTARRSHRVYEIFNENGFNKIALEGDYEKWPQYFQNEFSRNGTHGSRPSMRRRRLTAAWGKVDAGESLDRGR